jgi:hypothetical protein
MPQDDFYNSRAWIEIRYQAIKRYGAVCQCCGHPGSKDNPIQVDHIKSRYLHPELALDITNLQILCKQCNMGKGYRDQTDWRTYVKSWKDFKKIKETPPLELLLEDLKNSKEPVDRIVLAELNELVAIKKYAQFKIWERDQGRLALLKAERERRGAQTTVKRDLF